MLLTLGAVSPSRNALLFKWKTKGMPTITSQCYRTDTSEKSALYVSMYTAYRPLRQSLRHSWC